MANGFFIGDKRVVVFVDRLQLLFNHMKPTFRINNKFGSLEASDKGQGTLYLSHIQIKEPQQGHGTVFLLALEARAKREGFKRILLQAGSCENDDSYPNRKLVQWYKKRGYLAMPGTKGWLRTKKL